jgi:hypothetical protein
MNTACPVCQSTLLATPSIAGREGMIRFTCPRCGNFILTGTLIATLPHTLNTVPDAAAKLSHALRRAQEVNTDVMFSTHTIDEILKRPLPRPREQADLLIRWLAQNLPGPGEVLKLAPATHSGIIGAKTEDGFAFILDHLFASGLVTGRLLKLIDVPAMADATLTLQGWDYYETLLKGSTAYRKAFMAMKFGDLLLEQFVSDVFKPAAQAAGFDLFKLDDVPKAGLIDDRLRVEIQSSDFLIADLTHDNLGAYWEAGYAEKGLESQLFIRVSAASLMQPKLTLILITI